MLHDAFLIALICGLCSLDATVFLQGMFSRPLVAATLVGQVLGEPGAGFACGCLIELLWLGNLPVGSVVPPDFTLAACLASGMAISAYQRVSGLSWEACTSLALLVAIPVASVGGLVELWQRRRNAELGAWIDDRLEKGDEAALFKVIGLSVVLGFARSFGLAFMGMLLLAPWSGFLLESVPAWALKALEGIYWLSLLLGFVVLVDQFWEKRWLKVAALSFVASAILAYSLGYSGAFLISLAVALGLVLAVANELRLKHLSRPS